MRAAGPLQRNVGSSWAVTATGVIYALYSTPLVVDALGDERYGVWSFLNGLIGYSSLLYLGVGSALVKYIATHTARQDLEAINRLASVAVSIFCVLGLLALSVFVGLGGSIARVFAGGLAESTAAEASLACGLLGVQVLLFFLTSAFAATLMGHDRYDLANLAQILTTVVRTVFVAGVVGGERPLIRLAAFMVATSVMELALMRILARRTMPSLRLRPASPDRQELRLLYGFGIPAFLITFAVRLIHYTDTVIVGAVLGAASVGVYALALQLVEYARLVVSGYSSVLMAGLAVRWANGEVDAVRSTCVFAMRIGSVLAAFCLSNVVWLGPAFLSLWVGPTFGEQVLWILVWLALAAYLHVFSTIAAFPFYQVLHLLALPARVLALEAVLNVTLSIGLASTIGLDGVALATLLPALVTFAILPRALTRALSLPTAAVVGSAVLYGAAVAAVVSVAHLAASWWIPLDSYVNLAARAALTLPGTIGALWLLFPSAAHAWRHPSQ
jgi:O-antigen/teichoic acid export membrane protein